MSKFYDQADSIAKRITSLDLMDGARIVVDRQHDIAAEVSKVVARQTGSLVLIAWVGGKNIDETSDGPRIESEFTVTLFSKPVLRRDDQPADEIIESIAKSLHDWRPVPIGAYSDRAVVTGIYPTDIPDLLVHQIRLTLTSQL